jgi:hypothetical protein
VKFAEYEAEFINFHALYLVRPKSGGGWQSLARSSRQIPLFRDRLAELLGQAGFGKFVFWGDYAQTAFNAETSADLLVLAAKAE